jgi:hypothetical protein
MIRFGSSPTAEDPQLLSVFLLAMAFLFSILGRLKPNAKLIWPLLPADAPLDVRIRLGRAILAAAIVVLTVFFSYNLSQSGPYIQHLLSAK